METLVAVAHHRNQYYGGSRNGSSQERFFSSPSKGLSDVSCRGFEAGIGLLPSPCKGYGSPVLNRGLLSPKLQTTCAVVSDISPFRGSTGGKSKSDDVKLSKKFVKSSPIAIRFEGGSGSKNTKKERRGRVNMCFYERWAGPAYSNSPPPSSLPMPKFEMKPKRTVSLELPAFNSDLHMPVMSKSATSSLTRDGVGPSNDFFCDDDDFATKTLRRILNLDTADD